MNSNLTHVGTFQVDIVEDSRFDKICCNPTPSATLRATLNKFPGLSGIQMPYDVSNG
jgi:hypothetical protein